MSTRRAQSLPPAGGFEKEKTARGRCVSILIVLWKVFACVFSHVTLVTSVVAYCVLGAFTFEKLEADNEKTVKKGISFIRGNLTDEIWSMTQSQEVLHQNNWTMDVLKKIDIFELKIISEMKDKGWDGNENEAQLQWTKTGALFYSIIVITTIGYGHIAPKTVWGKVTTIFYAILGIPLMLLCLSNIGDIMASSFRFLYWRVCCFVCTREPKRSNSRRGRNRGGTVRHSNRSSARSHQNSFRRSMRTSQRSTDSGIDPYYDATAMGPPYSTSEYRYPVEQNFYDQRTNTIPRTNRSMNQQPFGGRGPGDKFRDRNGMDKDRMFNQENERMQQAPQRLRSGVSRFRDPTLPGVNPPRAHSVYRTADSDPVTPVKAKSQAQRGQSLDRRMMRREPAVIDFDQDPMCKTPVLCNRYAIEELDRKSNRKQNYSRSQSMPRQSPGFGDRLSVPHEMGQQQQRYRMDDEVENQQPLRKGRRRERSAPAPSARIMSPMGFRVNRQTHHVAPVMDDDEFDEWDSRSGRSGEAIIRPVPIWLCVFLVVSYIIAGAFLFHHWEGWSFLDSAYFCFITLTTIGFGDFVPAKGVSDNSQYSIALCSLYLLFGIALLAMSFNLVQEEVITNVKSVARRLGILKEEDEED